MNKKVGLFLGSFNPITTGHLTVANSVMNENLVDELWFLISPQNPLKKNRDDLISEKHRFKMVKRAIQDSDFIMIASDYEFSLPKPSYTFKTLKGLKKDFPKYDFYIVCGSDVQHKVHEWKNSELIINNFNFIVYKRNHNEECLNSKVSSKTTYIDAPTIDISSTYVRNLIKNNKSIKYIVSDSVIEYINKNKLYK